jgi:large subunit ribosomal protein L22
VPGPKTNERPGTRAVLKHYRMSATKARQVLDLIRGEDITAAHEILRTVPREGARVVDKVLHSAVSNAVEMSRQAGAAIDPEELFVSACFADEGATMKRWRPRARGRATRIRKRTCHITVIVSRLDDEKIARLRAKRTDATAALRSRRVAASRLRRRGGRGADGAASDETFADSDASDETPETDTDTGDETAETDTDVTDEATAETDNDTEAAAETDDAGTDDDADTDEGEGGEEGDPDETTGDTDDGVDTDEGEGGKEAEESD